MALETHGHTYGPVVLESHAHAQFGDQYGDQYISVNHFHQQPHAAARPHLQPSIVLPFRRNRDFVLRDEFSILWNRRNEQGSCTAIVGLGGIGKSHLAIEFAHRVFEENSNIWVFWAHASNAARFEESYKTIAESMQIPGRHEPQANVLILVNTWLSQREHGSWLMVVDNADDEHFVLGYDSAGPKNTHSNSSLPLSHYLPTASHGRILVTTRNRTVANGLTGYEEDVIHLGPMDSATAVQLLEKKLIGSMATRTADDLTILAQQLDLVPLALTQAAAYIRQRAPRMTVTKYNCMLQEGGDQRAKLLQTAVCDPWRDSEASSSIVNTWHQSFTYLRQRYPSASRLLSLMSLFDREAIPEDLLPGQYSAENHTTGGEVPDFEDDVATLQNFDLINSSVTANAFDMHRIVQFATQQWLGLALELAWWQQRCIEILQNNFPAGDYVDWPRCQTLFPHVASLRVADSAGKHVKEVYAEVLYRAIWYAKQRGLYDHAEKMAIQRYNIQRLLTGSIDQETLASLNSLGVVLLDRGKYDEAETRLRQALIGFEQLYGINHPYTLACAHSFGRAVESLGKYDEAEKLYTRVLVELEQRFGTNHHHVLLVLQSLAKLLQLRGKYSEADAMFRRVLAAQEQQFSVTYRDALATKCDLGLTLYKLGKYGEAETMLRQCHADYEQLLGANHPNTLTAMGGVGMALLGMGKYDEAETMLRPAIAGYEQHLGENHRFTLTSIGNLAYLLFKMEAWDEALMLYSRALPAMEARFEFHPDTAQCRRRFLELKEKIASMSSSTV